MGHSDNHTATRIPTVLAGRGGGMIKTGRYVRYAKNQELSSLHLANQSSQIHTVLTVVVQ